MATQRALVSLGPGRAQVVSAPRIASVPDRFILVKTVAVALNPIDWKVIDAGVNGTIIGCDYAGVVEEVGEGVTKAFKKGDRVYGTVHGCNLCSPDGGAFAEYVVAKGDLQTKVPDHLTFEEAATFGAGILTVCQGLFQHLGLALPSCPLAEGVAILIYGGSSATGSLAIQFARWYVIFLLFIHSRLCTGYGGQCAGCDLAGPSNAPCTSLTLAQCWIRTDNGLFTPQFCVCQKSGSRRSV